VIVTERVACPAVFGVFRPVLLMPATKLNNMDSRDMEHILLHELAHIKRGDLFVHAVSMCLQIAYWLNPLLWMIRRTMQNLRELCCDATVARLLKDDTVHYRQTLLETARGLLAQPVDPGLGLLGLFENSNWLVTRLQWLEKKTWKNRPLRIATVMALVSVMAVCVLPMANRTKDFAAEGTENIESNEFKKTLDNGVTIELVGICEHPSEGKQWWGPDGSLLEKSPYPKMETSHTTASRGRRAYEAAVRITGFDGDIGFSHRISDSGGGGSCGTDEPGLYAVSFSQPRNSTQAQIEIGVAAGPWQTVSTQAANISGVYSGRGIIWHGPVEQDGRTVLTMAHDLLEQDTRIVAVDKDGEEYTGGSTSATQGGMRSMQTRFRVRLSDVKEFRLQSRPYEWVTFKNAVLRPGVKTNVGMEIVKSESESPETADKTEAAGEGGSPQTAPASVEYTFSNGRWVEGDESAGKLEFRIAPLKSEVPRAELQNLELKLKEQWPYVESGLWTWRLADPFFDTALAGRLASTEHNGKMYVLVMNAPDMLMPADGSWGIESAALVQDMRGRPAVEVTFDEAGAASFYALTKKSIGQRLAILVNDKVVSAPHVQSAVRDRAIITGTFTNERAQQLASSLGKQMPPEVPVDIMPTDFELMHNQQRGVYSLAVKIRNDGEAALPKHRIRFYRGEPGQGLDETGHPHSGWHEAGPIEPGKEWNERTRDLHLPDGEYAFSVVLDYDNAVAETNEDNNTAALHVRIQDGTILDYPTADDASSDPDSSLSCEPQVGPGSAETFDEDVIKTAARSFLETIQKADYETILQDYRDGQWQNDGWRKLLPSEHDYLARSDFPGLVKWICQTFSTNPITDVWVGKVFVTDKEIAGRAGLPAAVYQVTLQDKSIIMGYLPFRKIAANGAELWQPVFGIDWHLREKPILDKDVNKQDDDFWTFGILKPLVQAGALIKIMTLSEKDLINGLKFCAELSDGRYPASLDQAAINEDLQRWVIEKYGETGFDNKTKHWLRDQVLKTFYMSFYYKKLQDQNKAPEYFGKEVKPGDSAQILLRWNKSEKEIRVIHGDLSADTIAAP
jgi:hypothetical protein